MYIILTQCFPSRVGGIESVVSNLSLSLGKKNKVIILADRHHIFYDAIFDNKHKDNIVVRRFGGLKYFRRRRKIKELKLLIKSGQTKLVIADTWKSLELCVDYLITNNIPTMCLAHGNELLSTKEYKKDRIVSTLAKVSTIVANSNYTRELVKKLIQDKNKIKVIYPGANDLRSIQAENFMTIKGDPVLLTLARLDKRKGHAKIIEVLKKLIFQFPKINYFIAGDGSEKSNLQKLVSVHNLEKSVHFTGIVNNHQKKYLFENVDLMIMPTLDESDNRSIEGFGISYLEASFFGIPSLASNVGGTPEAVQHDKTGLIISDQEELYDALEKLLSNKEKLNQLGKNAKKRAIEEFTWEVVSSKYLSLIKS